MTCDVRCVISLDELYLENIIIRINNISKNRYKHVEYTKLR